MVNSRFAVAAMVAAMAATPALAGPCGSEPCSTRVAVKGTSIVPPPDGSEFALRGDIFSSEYTNAALPANGSRQVDLGFTVNFGFGPVSSLYLNENGAVSFEAPLSTISGAPISNGAVRAVSVQNAATLAAVVAPTYQPVSYLAELGVPVIAPFYADLTTHPAYDVPTSGLLYGDVVVQYGLNDPFANDGAYDRADARSAVRITWYGMGVNGSSGSPTAARTLAAFATDADATSNSVPVGSVFAQLLITSSTDGADSFQFRYGPVDNPGQAGYGSIAGFSLGTNQLQFSGPYQDGIPTLFEFRNGIFVGRDATGAVPEPGTWALLLLGFAGIGLALRRRPGRSATALAA